MSQLCRNCGEKVEGTFCSNCGQKNDVGRLRLATLADNFLSTFVGDGAIGDKRSNIRYGFLMTIWATITRPGLTIAEYLEGRQRKYFNPVTILLMLSGFYALAGSFTGVVVEKPINSDNIVAEGYSFLTAYIESHPAMFYLLLLPFTALAYKWIFRKRSGLRYIEYAYVGIFSAIFSVTLLFLSMPFKLPLLADYGTYATWVCYAAQGWFSVAVFRMLFNVSIRRAVWSWLLVLVVSYTFAILTLILLLAAAAGTYYLFDMTGAKQTFGSIFEDGESEVLNNAADSLRTK